MTEARFFNFGEIFTKRAFISTIVGIALVTITEFLLPWKGIIQISNLWDWITPATIVLTIAIILVTSVIAKNIAASLLIGIAASLSFYNPYQHFSSGYLAVVIMYLVFAFFAGFFATKKMSGGTHLILIGVLFGLQGIIGGIFSLLLSINQSYQPYHSQGIPIAFGGSSNLPIYDIIVIGASVVYMIVFILLGARTYSITINNKTREIIGQILIFLGIVAPLIVQILQHKAITPTTATAIIGTTDVQFLNMIFAKTTAGKFTVGTLLNSFYLLPIAGMVIGIGLALIVYQRAEGTIDSINLDYEGAFIILNIPLALILAAFIYPWQSFIGASFYLNYESWYIVAAEYSNLVLINMVIAYILLRIIALIRKLITK